MSVVAEVGLDPSWMDVLKKRVESILSQISAVRKSAREMQLDAETEAAIVAPHYELLRTIYQEDFVIADAIASSDLLLYYTGPALDTDSPRVSLIEALCDNARRQVGAVALSLSRVTNRKTLPKDADLGLRAFARGSLFLGFSMPDPTKPDSNGETNLLGADDPLYKATREAIKTLGIISTHLALDGVASLQAIERDVPDPKLRDAALTAIVQLAPSGQKRTGIDSVSLGGREMPDAGFRSLTPATRKQIKPWMRHPVKSQEFESFTGTVREIDLDARRFELRRLSGTSIEEIRCIYPERLEKDVQTSLNRKITASGNIARSPDGNPRLLQIVSIVQG